MILTQCAVCATELGLSLGKKCGRCSTRYCGAECQKQHWEGGGHDRLCKKIKKAGGAEQFYANTKYSEAVTVAVEACAEDTKGQTCYICMEAVHPRTGEGLVRGCACGDRPGVASGTTGIAHMSCLAEQAKILVAEALENKWDNARFNPRWIRWSTCSLCKQDHHGVVACALGWACWKTYLGRPDADSTRLAAMTRLGNGLMPFHPDGALVVYQATVAAYRRFHPRFPSAQLVCQNNIAGCMSSLGRHADAIVIYRAVYETRLATYGNSDPDTIISMYNLSASLVKWAEREGKPDWFAEARSLTRGQIPVAQQVLGPTHEVTLKIRATYADAIRCDMENCSREEMMEAASVLTDVAHTAYRVLGAEHPLTREIRVIIDESVRKGIFDLRQS